MNKRQQFINDLRHLAVILEACPELPVPDYPEIFCPVYTPLTEATETLQQVADKTHHPFVEYDHCISVDMQFAQLRYHIYALKKQDTFALAE